MFTPPRHKARGPLKLDELTLDLHLTFTKETYSGEVRLILKVSSYKFYGPGARFLCFITNVHVR